MNYLILLRHGQSLWNLDNKFTGATDIDLSDLGRKEAERSGEYLKNIRFDKVFSSTLMRAQYTAEIALTATGKINAHLQNNNNDGLKFIITCHANLNERDYGELVGLNKDETRKKFGEEQVKIWRRSYDTPPPGGESLKDVVARVSPYYKAEIKPKIDAGKNILIAAHGNSLRAMLIALEIKTAENINEMEIPTGVPILIEFKNGILQSWRMLEDK